MRLADLVGTQARTRPDAPAVTDGTRSLTWRGVVDLAQLLRRPLGDRVSGRRIAVCGDPGIAALSLVLAALDAGASIALLASADLGRTDRAIEVWGAHAWISVDPADPLDRIEAGVVDVARRLGPRRSGRSRSGAVPAIVFSTSGSTGDPRLVSCPDRTFSAVSHLVATTLGLGPHDRILSTAPAHFDYGFHQFVLGASSGAALLRSDEVGLAHRISGPDRPVSVLASGPSQLRSLVGLPEARTASSSIRLVTSTGAAFPVEIADQLTHLWPEAQVRPMYGMTECKRVSIATHAEFAADPTTVGQPLPGLSVAVDPVTDEILVRTPYLMDFDSVPGAEGPRVVEIDGDRVLATGDLGRLTGDGQLEILGRRSQFVKIDDVRVSLAECERVAVHQPLVREVAAAAVGDRLGLWCEVTGPLDEDQVRAEIRRALVDWNGSAGVAQASVTFTSHLPRLPNGKIDRLALAHTVGV